MAITLSTAAREGACNGIVDLLDAATADFQFLDGATPIVVIDCAVPAFGASSVGVATLAGTPRTGTATDSSTTPGVDVFNVRDSADATIFSGSAGGTGSGADVEFDNAIVLTDQVVNLTSFTLTVPAS